MLVFAGVTVISGESFQKKLFNDSPGWTTKVFCCVPYLDHQDQSKNETRHKNVPSSPRWLDHRIGFSKNHAVSFDLPDGFAVRVGNECPHLNIETERVEQSINFEALKSGQTQNPPQNKRQTHLSKKQTLLAFYVFFWGLPQLSLLVDHLAASNEKPY